MAVHAEETALGKGGAVNFGRNSFLLGDIKTPICVLECGWLTEFMCSIMRAWVQAPVLQKEATNNVKCYPQMMQDWSHLTLELSAPT